MIKNRRVLYEYQVLEVYEAGLVLTGGEVKSVRGGRMTLEGSFVRITGSEIYLVNAQIFPYPFARPENYDPRRTRKLLMHKREIISLKSKLSAEKLTLIPLECYVSKGVFKLKVGLARGKKDYEKREKIRRHDIDLDTARQLREKK